MRKVTVEEIVGLNPCSQYNEEYVEKLFNGQKAVSVQYILELPIPRLDKIWIIDKLGLISDEAIGKIHQKLTDLITDKESAYRERFRESRIWQYAPVFRFLQETNKDYTRKFLIDFIEDLIVFLVKEELDANTSIL